jgi:hypothetical protein
MTPIRDPKLADPARQIRRYSPIIRILPIHYRRLRSGSAPDGHATPRSADARSLTGSFVAAAQTATITPILARMAAVRDGHTNGRSLRIRDLDQPGLQSDRDPRQQRTPRGDCCRPDRSWQRNRDRIGGPVSMGRAIGWVVIVGLVLVLGTHPGIMADLVHHLFDALRGAGNELSSFLGSF